MPIPSCFIWRIYCIHNAHNYQSPPEKFDTHAAWDEGRLCILRAMGEMKGRAVKGIALLVLCIAIILLIPGATTIEAEPQGSTRISNAIGAHAAENDLWFTLVASTVLHLSQGSLPRVAREPGIPSMKPNRAVEHRVAENDTPPEPGTILLFGMGLIALTYRLKFRIFKR